MLPTMSTIPPISTGSPGSAAFSRSRIMMCDLLATDTKVISLQYLSRQYDGDAGRVRSNGFCGVLLGSTGFYGVRFLGSARFGSARFGSTGFGSAGFEAPCRTWEPCRTQEPNPVEPSRTLQNPGSTVQCGD